MDRKNHSWLLINLYKMINNIFLMILMILQVYVYLIGIIGKLMKKDWQFLNKKLHMANYTECIRRLWTRHCSNSKSEQLINLLQNFAEEEESNPSDSDELELQQEIITGDKENFDPSIPKLQNPKIRRGKGWPLGTKRFKSSCEANKTKSKTQHHCKRCGLAGHYQKNCKVFSYSLFTILLLFIYTKIIIMHFIRKKQLITSWFFYWDIITLTIMHYLLVNYL